MKHCVKFSVPGGKSCWLTSKGTGTLDPDAAHDFGSREAAEKFINSRGPRDSASYRYVTHKEI